MTRKQVRAKSSAPHAAYPVRTVARMTDLSPDLIRAWEKRYAVVAPIRGPRGARLYSADDVRHLRLLAMLVAEGRAIGDIAALDTDALRALLRGGLEVDVRERPSAPPDEGAPLERILGALARYDVRGLEQSLGEALFGLGNAGFVRRVAAPLLREVGDRWSTGEISIAQEHIFSGTLRNLLGSVLRLHRENGEPSLLLASPSGERHEFGLILVALLAIEAGLSVTYLGTDLPAVAVIASTRHIDVAAVGLSLVCRSNRRQAVEEVRTVERQLPPECELWLGGADASAVAERTPRSRALVLLEIDDIEAHARRLQATAVAMPTTKN